MDYGTIARSRIRFRAFMLTPVILVSMVVAAIALYSHRTQQSLDMRRAFMDMLPALNDAMTGAGGALSVHEPHEAGVSAEYLRDTITKAATSSGFTLTSLSVRTGDAKIGKGSTIIKDADWVLEFEGEAALAILIRFCNELQKFPGLLLLEEMEMSARGMDAQSVYAGAFLMSYHETLQ